MASVDPSGKFSFSFQGILYQEWYEDQVLNASMPWDRVSNFSVENLELLLKSADIVPAVNQVSLANSSPNIMNSIFLCNSLPAPPTISFCHVSQVEANIYHPQASLHTYCAEKNIHLTAYCPIGQPKPEVGSKVLKDEVLIGLGEKYGKPAAAVSTTGPDILVSPRGPRRCDRADTNRHGPDLCAGRIKLAGAAR